MPELDESIFLRRAMILATVALTMIVGPTYSTSAEETVLPAGARLMTPKEIHEIYGGKSWRWKSGAGYLSEAGRQFSAWADDEKGKSWAEGRWIITKTGRMCLDATWHSPDGKFPVKTCFAHRMDKGTIYQEREPSGEWHVFRQADSHGDDEAAKLSDVDLVSAKIASVKAELDSNQSSQQ